MIGLLTASQQHFPEGWIDTERDMLWWGSSAAPTTVVAVGARLRVPDLRSADNRTILDIKAQNYSLLSCLQEGDALQIHWSIDDDYFGDIARFERETEELRASGKLRRFSAELREDRAKLLRNQLGTGTRRREQIHVYLTSSLGDTIRQYLPVKKRLFGVSTEALTGYMDGAAEALHSKLNLMQSNFNIGAWEMMDAQAMTTHIRKVLNPALESSIAEAGSGAHPVDPMVSIRENCLRSDITVFEYGVPPKGTRNHPAGLYYQGNYHGFFVLYRLPATTRPGMWLNVFNSVDRCVSVTQTLVPLTPNEEIVKLQKEIEELVKFIYDPKSEGVGSEIVRKRERLDSLMEGATQPFSAMTLVRVWGATLEEFEKRVGLVRTALGTMEGGGEFIESSDRECTRRLFLDNLPGYTRYALDNARRKNTWVRGIENHNLTDLLPFSSTFTGHLDEAQVLLDSPSGGVVGIRFLAQGTPQHTSVTGVTGAGKTVMILEILSQLEGKIDYLFIQEEGMAFAPYAMIRNIPSIVMRDSSDFTINPFDTFRQPLTSSNAALISKLGIKIVGIDKDESKNRRRENLIAEYASSLYKDLAEDLKGRDEERWFRLTKKTMLVHRSRCANDDFRDGYLNYQELLVADSARVAEIEAAISESDVIDFQTNPRTRDLISAMVYTDLNVDEYPTWAALVSVMKSARFSHHKSGQIADELNYLCSDLSRGLRFGGTLGALIDGPTNVNLHGDGLHFDTSFLSEGLLKGVAGFLFPAMIRQHIISLPRSQFKFMVLDEMRRILLIPGAAEYIKEMLAQLRKYRATMIAAFQGPSQIDEIDPSLTTLIFGQCKQHFLMRQNDRSEITRIAEAIGLPPAAQRAIASHPLIEHQRGETRRSYFTLFSRDGVAPTCGTVAVESFPQLVWVASSNGDIFDRKQRIMRSSADPLEAVHREVERDMLKKSEAKTLTRS